MLKEGCMGRFHSRGWYVTIAILSLWTISGCGGKKAGGPIFAARVTLTPSSNTSIQLGSTFNFTALVQSGSGTNISTTIAYSSSDTSILNVSPAGVACAGRWEVGFTVCTPGGIGVVKVTAEALGATSAPTYVFVHPAIDNITVTGVLLNGIPVQEPCLSQGQSMTVEAHAFSQGTDITASVGPFTWTARDTNVVTITPIINNNATYNFPTNQAAATAGTPGLTEIYASASGATSTYFQQPTYNNSQGTASPILDFFETCPIQTIKLELNQIGSGQTGFVGAKATPETVYATLTDAMGNSSLPNTAGQVVLTEVPLTWTASQPAVFSGATTCTQSCALSIPSSGAGTVTASCSPPTCNIGFPESPPILSSAACTQFFSAQFPQIISCQQFIPSPVYASAAVSGLVTGAAGAASVVATSLGCAQVPPLYCQTGAYSVSTTKASPGGENPIPVSPNSLLFDPAGDRAYMGSDFGAQAVNPASFGGSSSAFSPLSTVTGTVLAVSNNGAVALFSDTLHNPNEVYIANTTTSNSAAATVLPLPNTVAGGFSPDGLKTFIFANGGNSLYIYSPLQALQGPIALSGPANSIVFSPNSAFAYVAEAAANGNPANLTAFATCNNQIPTNNPTNGSTPIPAIVDLPTNPILMKILPDVHIDGTDSAGNPIPDGIHIFILDSTGFDILTSVVSPLQPGTSCPQGLTFVSGDPTRLAQRVELEQGTIQPINFFSSPDASQLYVVAAGRASILVYDFSVGSVTSGIALADSATPVSADISVDAGTIFVAGSDGMLHEVTTALGGSDSFQITFPNLPSYLNPFCTFTPNTGACTFNLVAARP